MGWTTPISTVFIAVGGEFDCTINTVYIILQSRHVAFHVMLKVTAEFAKSQGHQLDGQNGHSARWSQWWSHDKQFHSTNFILGNTHLKCGGCLSFILSLLPLL